MKKLFSKRLYYAAAFAVLNVLMYLVMSKFWIGGSSFLPLIGDLGAGNKFLFAFLVNVGLILGSFLGAVIHKEFIFRLPKKSQLPKIMIGGFLIGMGVTLCPGTCTTAFVTGIPMLSVSSFLSASGIILGAFISYKILVPGK